MVIETLCGIYDHYRKWALRLGLEQSYTSTLISDLLVLTQHTNKPQRDDDIKSANLCLQRIMNGHDGKSGLVR